MTYIAGKVTGDKNYMQKFQTAEAVLGCYGYTELVNPARLVDDGSSWSHAMRLCIEKLVACDTIVLLPDWWRSRGAWVEMLLARVLGMRVVSLKQALK